MNQQIRSSTRTLGFVRFSGRTQQIPLVLSGERVSPSHDAHCLVEFGSRNVRDDTEMVLVVDTHEPEGSVSFENTKREVPKPGSRIKSIYFG